MTRSYVLLDNSGSMMHLRETRDAIAVALLGSASPSNQIGLISFADRVKIDSYYESNPAALLARFHAVPPPWGMTELSDAIVVALSADIVKPDNLFIISDGGENASETSPAAISAFIKAVDPGVNLFALKPPPPPVVHPVAPFFVEPPGKIALLAALGPKVVDLSKLTDQPKFLDALKRLHDGRIQDLVR